MPKLNRDIILSNLAEAREEIEAIEAELRSKQSIDPIHFRIWMQHAFHHLNFAWNIRHWPTKRYTSLSKEDFQAAGKFPTDLHTEAE